MKISELEKRLGEIREAEGDLEILGCGYPGDVGASLTEGELHVFVEEGEKVLFFMW